MRVAVLSHALPQPSTNGGPMTCWSVMTKLLEAGHEVVVGALEYPGDVFAARDRAQAVREQGAELVVVPLPPEADLHAASDPADDITRTFPTASYASEFRDLILARRPEAAFVYHWDTLAATRMLGVPRLAAVDDPWHLPIVRRWQRSPVRLHPSYLREAGALLLKSVPRATAAMVTLLNEAEVAGCFQAHAAGWLRRHGARHCTYFRAPLVDASTPLRATGTAAKPRILLGPSNLEATSTSAGLDLFAREILPHLERQLGIDGFEVHVVGEGRPPHALARLLPRPSVVLRGRVEPADEEFQRSWLQLVPTPFVLGKRVRIIVAFSFACPVVAHAVEAANLPELEHGKNALLAGTGRGLADAVIRVLRDSDLRRRLGDGGRRTYEQYFHPDVAATPLVARLERLASGAGLPAQAAVAR